ncbi:MAG: hypothetical protein K1W16_08075 [Lachnospiraceae bacterium]|jgi:hypothetical protein
MRRTNKEMSRMAQDKINSPKTVDRLVADELLEMGFSYNHMGTHYLHDSIVQSAKMSLEDFKNVSEFCLRIAKVVCRKYSTRYVDKIRVFECGFLTQKDLY